MTRKDRPGSLLTSVQDGAEGEATTMKPEQIEDYGGAAWQAKRERALQAANYRCQNPDCPDQAIHGQTIIPSRTLGDHPTRVLRHVLC